MPKGKKSNQHNQRTIWLPGEEAILRKHKDTWINMDSKQERDAFAAGLVTEEIRHLSPHLYGALIVGVNKKAKDEWDRKSKAIKNWFNNHRGPATLRRVFKFERKIPLRHVIGHCERPRIDERAQTLFPDMRKDSKASFSQYQKALSAVIKDMTEDEKKPYEEIRTKWQNQGPPEEIKRKTARKYAKRIILNMHEVGSKQMGLRSVTIASHTREDGTLGYTLHDYNHEMNPAGMKIMSFVEYNPRICKELGDAFADWVDYVDLSLKGKPCGGDEKPNIAILMGPGGLPILPPPIINSKSGIELQATQRSLLRLFFKQHYRIATGNPNAHPPWEAMGDKEKADRMFNKCCVPEGFVFADPTRMKAAVTPLIAHLRERQALDGEVAFQFKKVFVNGELIPAQYPREALAANKQAACVVITPQVRGSSVEPIAVGETIAVADVIGLTQDELRSRQRQQDGPYGHSSSAEMNAVSSENLPEPQRTAEALLGEPQVSGPQAVPVSPTASASPASLISPTANATPAPLISPTATASPASLIFPTATASPAPLISPAVLLPSVVSPVVSSDIPPNEQPSMSQSITTHPMTAVSPPFAGAAHLQQTWPASMPHTTPGMHQLYAIQAGLPALYSQGMHPPLQGGQSWPGGIVPIDAAHYATQTHHANLPPFQAAHPPVIPADAVHHLTATSNSPGMHVAHPPGMPSPESGPPSFHQPHLVHPPFYAGMQHPTYNSPPVGASYYYGYYPTQSDLAHMSVTAPYGHGGPAVNSGAENSSSPSKGTRARKATGLTDSPSKKPKLNSSNPETPIEKRKPGRPRK